MNSRVLASDGLWGPLLPTIASHCGFCSYWAYQYGVGGEVFVSVLCLGLSYGLGQKPIMFRQCLDRFWMVLWFFFSVYFYGSKSTLVMNNEKPDVMHVSKAADVTFPPLVCSLSDLS